MVGSRVFNVTRDSRDKSVREILFLPYSENFNNQHIMVHIKRGPIFSNPEPVTWDKIGAVLNLHDIMPLVRAGSKPLKDIFDPDTVFLRDSCQVFLCPAGKNDLVQDFTASGP